MLDIRGDYQQYVLAPDGAVASCGERMDAKLAALQSTGLAPDFVAGHSVLDVGCDCGFWSFMASTAGARSVVGVDRNRDVRTVGYVDLVAQNTGIARRFPRHDRVHFRAANVGRQWPEYGLFDVVFAMSVTHHIYAQCGDHDSVWFWLARHVVPGGLLIWEGPTDDADPVIRANVPQVLRAGYTLWALEGAASRYFDLVASRPALHESTRSVWLMRRNGEPTGRVIDRYEMRDGAGGATKAFQREGGRRMDEIEQALGVRPVPGSLNLVLPEPFDWSRDYYRVQVLDSTDRGDPEAPWAPRWCRFYPIAIGRVGGWAMRFEGEKYDERFVEVIGPHRFRDLVVDDGTVDIGGLAWPTAGGRRAAEAILVEVATLDQVMPFVRGRRLAVQAGGNVGVYPLRLARDFERVVTFEPDAENFACLQRNIVAAGNIEARQVAVGEKIASVGLERAPANCGAHFVAGHGDVGQIAIDDQGLDACDLICLDVEGYEMAALRGAAKMIARFKPVILYEDKGCGDRYGVKRGEIEKWLAAEFGYKVVGRNNHDVLVVSA
jgi:FkbM family methyltransferase